jgi:glutaconyl-CoA decarboxylase
MRKFTVNVNGVDYKVTVQEDGAVSATPAPVVAAPVVAAPVVAAPVAAAPVVAVPAATVPVAVSANATVIKAPMPGKITSVDAKVGQAVKKGDLILVLEAMKMQNEISATVDGTISDIRVTAGANVKTGEVMVVLG